MKRKRISAVGLAVVTTLVGCSAASAVAQEPSVPTNTAWNVSTPLEEANSPWGLIAYLVEKDDRETMMEQQARQEEQRRIAAHLRAVELQNNLDEIEAVISKLEARVGKTWYVFSGSTPQGWDCSGLVMWTYEHLGYELEHRASKQKYSGRLVTEPTIGDIVAFTYNGSKSAYHVGIWVAPDTMIHSGGGKGDRTEFESISAFAGDYSNVTYTRLIDTPIEKSDN